MTNTREVIKNGALAVGFGAGAYFSFTKFRSLMNSKEFSEQAKKYDAEILRTYTEQHPEDITPTLSEAKNWFYKINSEDLEEQYPLLNTAREDFIEVGAPILGYMVLFVLTTAVAFSRGERAVVGFFSKK